MDATGSFTAAVREKAALALSSLESKTAFEGAHASGNLSFPVLASVRVNLSKEKESGDSQSQAGGATEPTADNAEGNDEVLQTNHCHVAVPGSGEQALTRDGDCI